MKVRISKSVEIDTDVDVGVEDVLSELSERLADPESDIRSVVANLAWIARILEVLPQSVIQSISYENRKIISDRLFRESERYLRVR